MRFETTTDHTIFGIGRRSDVSARSARGSRATSGDGDYGALAATYVRFVSLHACERSVLRCRLATTVVARGCEGFGLVRLRSRCAWCLAVMVYRPAYVAARRKSANDLERTFCQMVAYPRVASQTAETQFGTIRRRNPHKQTISGKGRFNYETTLTGCPKKRYRHCALCST